MPSFDYTALDRQGNSIQGQVQAANRDEAALNLTRSGLLVSKLAEAGGMFKPTAASQAQIVQTPTASKPQSAQRAGPPPQLKASPATQQARSAPTVRPIQSTSRDPIRTKRGSDKELYFIFSQLQSYANSGQNPVVSLTNVGNGCKREDYRQAMLAAADAAKEGRPISDTLERYIDLFPPHVIGEIRAAEVGGFFPDAYQLITEQALSSKKFIGLFHWFRWVAIMTIFCAPVMLLAVRAALKSWDIQDKSGGTAPGFPTLFASMGRELLWPTGPLSVIAGFGVWGLYRCWNSMKMRQARHRAILSVPIMGKRARSESLSMFAWNLGMLAKSGLPPKVVWDLSVAAIPNLSIQSELAETSSRMTEQTKLSEAMTMSRQLPEEYGPIMQTGEYTGDVSTALFRASSAQLDEFKATDMGSRAQLGCWIALMFAIGALIAFGLLYGTFYGQMFQKLGSD